MLFVYPRGESFTGMYVKGSDTVLSIKQGLGKKSRLPPEHIELDFEGTVMEDTRTLASYGISNATSTMVGARYTASASDMFILHIRQSDGSIITLNQQPNYKFVNDVKAEYERLTGIPSAKQMLYFKGQLLNQVFLGLDVPVREGDTVDIKFKSAVIA